MQYFRALGESLCVGFFAVLHIRSHIVWHCIALLVWLSEMCVYFDFLGDRLVWNHSHTRISHIFLVRFVHLFCVPLSSFPHNVYLSFFPLHSLIQKVIDRKYFVRCCMIYKLDLRVLCVRFEDYSFVSKQCYFLYWLLKAYLTFARCIERSNYIIAQHIMRTFNQYYHHHHHHNTFLHPFLWQCHASHSSSIFNSPIRDSIVQKCLPQRVSVSKQITIELNVQRKLKNQVPWPGERVNSRDWDRESHSAITCNFKMP